MMYFDMMLICIVFFFSSRRRHTRFDCDWSSDVCSSDLVGRCRVRQAGSRRRHERGTGGSAGGCRSAGGGDGCGGIGRGAGRGKGEISGGAGSLKKKKK